MKKKNKQTKKSQQNYLEKKLHLEPDPKPPLYWIEKLWLHMSSD